MLDNKFKKFFIDWYNGLFTIGMGLFVCITIYFMKNNQEFISKLQEGLPYDLAVFLIGVCSIAFGFIMISEPITKQLLKIEKVRTWITKMEEKKRARQH